MKTYFVTFSKHLLYALVFLGFIAFAPTRTNAQSQELQMKDIRSERPLGVSAVIGSPVLAGGALDYFVSPQLNIRATFGSPADNTGVGIGLNFHTRKRITNTGLSPFLGLEVYHQDYDINIFCDECGVSRDLILFYAPVGITWLTEVGFTASLEGALMFMFESEDPGDTVVSPWGAVRFGYRFKL